MSDFSIGVDLGGTNLRIAAVSADGKLLDKISVSTRIALGPDYVVNDMCDAIQRLSSQHGANGALRGAGIGVPGIIDLEAGVVRMSANLPGWSGYPVRKEIEKRLGTPIFLENDGKVAALGEKWLGAAREVDNMAMLTLGTGIGGCMVFDAKIFHGLNGMAGEFGHVTIDPEGIPCNCGNRGCSERYASGSAVLRMAREAIDGGDAPALAHASEDPSFSAKSVYELAVKGDPPAQRIFCSFGRSLGILLAGLINILNVEMFVIGGGVSSAWDAFAPTMFKEIRERSTVYAQTVRVNPEQSEKEVRISETKRNPGETIITRAVLGSDAGLYGGAKLALG